MQNNDVRQFIETLKAEASLVERFVALLSEEQSLLSDGNIDAIIPLLAQKGELAGQLEALGEQRNDLLRSQGLTADRAGMDAWCTHHSDNLASTETWPRIIAGAREAQRLNRLNGELIRLRMQYNTQALEALRRGDTSLNLYGPNGQATARTTTRLNDAV